MLESFLVGGAQTLEVNADVTAGKGKGTAGGTDAGRAGDAGKDGLVYGQSVTDACMDWDVTASVLGQLAASARTRRTRA
jgi:3-deoxy-7-phosphoheptulonate synthase